MGVSALFVDTRGSYVASEKQLVALLGVENVVVVATADAVLIARRSDAHLVAAASKRHERWLRITKQAAEQSRRVGVPEILSPMKLQDLAKSMPSSAARVVLAEASLSFLGLGVQPPTPSWGTMLNAAQQFLESAPWMAIFPGLAISLGVFGFSLFGDAVRDELDPKLRSQ